jgi:2',3'-cyclic-nucleotide 2'-phosphodiesterase (5'-nucleotidase family)
VLEVAVGGAPLDPARSYTVATTDYLARGGDGYAALQNGTPVVDAAAAPLLANLVMDYLLARGEAAPPDAGRISVQP